MRLLIDLQACQSTSSRTRGIGRYSIELAKAMVRQGIEHDIHLLLNAAFPDSIIEIRRIFADRIPDKNIHLWYGVSQCNELQVENNWRLRSNELIREQAIREIAPDIIHVSSLFEGLSDDAVVSVPPVSAVGVPVAVTLYDLIPLINAETYLVNEHVRRWYYRKVQSLKRAQLLLAISESSRREGISYLSVPEDAVVNISSAVDERFTVHSFAEAELHEVRDRYGLHRDFVMYTGGIDLRKNIEGLIEAYANLPNELRQSHQLAIVCSVHEHDRQRLYALAHQLGLQKDEFVLTGFVPDQDLPKLYHACKLFVFPSWHEGFGLPALEAMSCGAPVIAANTSSLPEVLGWDEAMFDPRDISAITNKIQWALEDAVFRKSLVAFGLEQSKKFSWDASARVALAALNDYVLQHRRIERVTTLLHRPKLAYISPVPPAQSGIADYSAELIRELAVHYDIEIITDQDKVSDQWLLANFPIRSPAWFLENADGFQRTLYHVGNSTFHEYMLDLMQLHPGVVVLHDFFLSGLMAHLDFTGKRAGIWNKLLFESHGYAALYDKATTTELNQIIWDYPCNYHVLERAFGLIVHSQFSQNLAQAWYGPDIASNWQVIPLMRALPPNVPRNKARQQFGLSDDDFLICSFGILGPTKLNQTLLDAWLMSPLAKDARCKLVFVGKHDEGDYGATMQATIAEAQLGDRITITGFADAELFQRYLSAADVAVQLRGISRGETSAAVLDCLAYGIPTIINKNGAMAELPDGPLIRLEEQFEVSQLSEQLLAMWNSLSLRESYSSAARKYIHEQHDPHQIATQYKVAIESFYNEGAAANLRRTMGKIAELDGEYDESDVVAVADALERNRHLLRRKRLLLYCGGLAESSHAHEIRQFVSLLLESLPRHCQVIPIQVIGGQIRVAASLMESFLEWEKTSTPEFELEPVGLSSMDVVLMFEATSASNSSVCAPVLESIQICGAQCLKLSLQDICDHPKQNIEGIFNKCL